MFYIRLFLLNIQNSILCDKIEIFFLIHKKPQIKSNLNEDYDSGSFQTQRQRSMSDTVHTKRVPTRSMAQTESTCAPCSICAGSRVRASQHTTLREQPAHTSLRTRSSTLTRCSKYSSTCCETSTSAPVDRRRHTVTLVPSVVHSCARPSASMSTMPDLCARTRCTSRNSLAASKAWRHR